MTIYVCSVCKVEFNNKSHYNAHQKRKFRCNPPEILKNDNYYKDLLQKILLQNDVDASKNDIFEIIRYMHNEITELKNKYALQNSNNNIHQNIQYIDGVTNIYTNNVVNITNLIINSKKMPDNFLNEEQKQMIFRKVFAKVNNYLT